MANNIDELIEQRTNVYHAYEYAKSENKQRFSKGDDKATAEYIFPNQIDDAQKIVDMFYKDKRRVISIRKKTKVGADGLMIEIAKLLTTHPDNNFIVNIDNVRILTGMSNASWEKDMIDKAPPCFKNKIFHHGKLSKSDLQTINNSIIIIDEIDTGDKELQRLHKTLNDAGILDVNYMEEHNIRFVFISATMVKELYDLTKWGELHGLYTMTIPPSYIGHIDFLNMGIIKEFYPLNTDEKADKWIQEDIINNYINDFRVHIVRINNKNINIIKNSCIRNNIEFRIHTSDERLTDDEIKEFFKDPLNQHIVLGVKGFFRRADLIPNSWKRRIGAIHEFYTKKVDNNVQVQGLPGRMTGYWRSDIEGGHKTGPYRTSIKAIKEDEANYYEPFGKNSYQTSGFKKKNGKVLKKKSTMLSTQNINNLEAVDLPKVEDIDVVNKNYRIYHNENIAREVCEFLDYQYSSFSKKVNKDGFIQTSLNKISDVVSLDDAVKKIKSISAGGGGGGIRTCYPCYVDITDKSTLRFAVVIRPETDINKIKECDNKFESIEYIDDK
jgi:hypothetical protein